MTKHAYTDEELRRTLPPELFASVEGYLRTLDEARESETRAESAGWGGGLRRIPHC